MAPLTKDPGGKVQAFIAAMKKAKSSAAQPTNSGWDAEETWSNLEKMDQQPLGVSNPEALKSTIDQPTSDESGPTPTDLLEPIRTPGKGNLCGLYALRISLKHQLPTVIPPNLEELVDIGDELDLADASNFDENQLGKILRRWGKKNGHNLVMGLVRKVMNPYVMDSSDLDGKEMVIYIHSDDAQLLHRTALNHWSGMAPPGHGLDIAIVDAEPSVRLEEQAAKLTTEAIASSTKAEAVDGNGSFSESSLSVDASSSQDNAHKEEMFQETTVTESPKPADPDGPRELVVDYIATQAAPTNEDPPPKKALLKVIDLVAPPRDPDAQMNEILRNFFKQVPRYQGESMDNYRTRCEQEGSVKETIIYDALQFQNLGVALPAVYFHPVTGQRLIEDSAFLQHRENFSMKYERHMPSFMCWVWGKSDEPLAVENVPKDEVADLHDPKEDGKHEQMREQDLDDIWVPEEEFATKDESFRSSSRVNFNFESLESLSYVDMTLEASNDEEQQLLDRIPRAIHEFAIDLVANHRGHPIFIWVSFDAAKAAKYRTHVGTPAWAAPWAEQVATGSLTLVVDGDRTALMRIQALEALLQSYRQTGSPLNMWFNPGPKRWVFSGKWLNVDRVPTEGFRYVARLVFHSFLEYLVTLAVSVLSERRFEIAQADEWENYVFNLRLAEIPRAGNRAYLGWFELPFKPTADVQLERPSAGTLIEVTFPSQWNIISSRRSKAEVWIARVIEASPGPSDMIPVTVSRPWNGTLKKHSVEKVRAIDSKSVSIQTLASRIKRDPGNKVRMTVYPEFKVSKARLRAIEDFSFCAKGRPAFTQFNEDMKIALVGSNIHTLKNRDVFAPVREEFGDVTTLMDLNAQQVRAVRALQDTPAGLGMIHGPPGTGKTKTGIELVVPYVMSKDEHQVLFVTSANVAVDSIARKLEERIEQLREEKLLKRKVYMIRVYSPSAEQTIRDIKMEALGKRDTSAKRPANLQGVEVNTKLMDAVSAIFYQHYTDANTPVHKGKYAGIRDKRVLTPELSLVMMTLEVIGYFNTEHTYPVMGRFAELRGNIRRFEQGDLEKDTSFGKQWKDAMDFTLRGAAVVVATTDYAGLQSVMSVLEQSCKLIIGDDNPRESEDQLMPLLSTRAPLAGFVMLGDILKLPPTVTIGPKYNAYAEQRKISLMTRMVHIGLPYQELCVQHRMNEHLCKMANELTYDGKLRTHTSARYENQPKSKAFGRFTRRFLGHAKSHILLDFRADDVDGAETQFRGTSRFNELYARLGVGIAICLLELDPTATVAMITAYAAQRDILNQAIANLVAEEPELTLNDGSRRIFAHSIESTQGEEFDYVVDCILPADGLGHQKDPRRGNVATTRAKHGYVLITDRRECKGSSPRQLGFVGRLLNYLKHSRRSETIRVMPPCKYLPSLAEQRTSISIAIDYFEPKAAAPTKKAVAPAKEASKATATEKKEEIDETTADKDTDTSSQDASMTMTATSIAATSPAATTTDDVDSGKPVEDWGKNETAGATELDVSGGWDDDDEEHVTEHIAW